MGAGRCGEEAGHQGRAGRGGRGGADRPAWVGAPGSRLGRAARASAAGCSPNASAAAGATGRGGTKAPPSPAGPADGAARGPGPRGHAREAGVHAPYLSTPGGAKRGGGHQPGRVHSIRPGDAHVLEKRPQGEGIGDVSICKGLFGSRGYKGSSGSRGVRGVRRCLLNHVCARQSSLLLSSAEGACQWYEQLRQPLLHDGRRQVKVGWQLHTEPNALLVVFPTHKFAK